MSLLFLMLFIVAPWIGLGLLVKLIWTDCAKNGQGMFFRNSLNAESWVIGVLWPIMLPFFITMVVLYGIITMVHWASNRSNPVNH